MSFHEISIAVRAENYASAAFRSVALDVANLGAAFGILSNEHVKAISVFFTIIRVIQSFQAILGITNTTAATAATVQTTLTAVQTTYGGVMGFVAAAQAWFNAHLAATLVMTGLGIALVIAAAAAMSYFASQTNVAAGALRGYNEELDRTRTRAIQRRGEEELYTRGLD